MQCTHAMHTVNRIIIAHASCMYLFDTTVPSHCCRLWTVRFYSYFSLLIAVTVEIECTQPPSDETGGQCSLSFSIQDVANPVADPTADGPCPVVSGS